LKNTFYDLAIDDSRVFDFRKDVTAIQVETGIYPYVNNTITKNKEFLVNASPSETFGSLDVVILNKRTANVLANQNYGLYNKFFSQSCSRCLTVSPNQFFFSYSSSKNRKFASDFFDSIPVGNIIIIQNWNYSNFSNSTSFIDTWKKDTLIWGSGQSLYHKFKNLGLSQIDSFYKNIPFVFILEKKLDKNWSVISQQAGTRVDEMLISTFSFNSFGKGGNFFSQLLGPAKSWSSIHWTENPLETNSADEIKYKVYGLQQNFSESLVYSSSSKIKDTSIAFIDAKNYPYLRIEQENKDTVNNTPWQQRYLQVKYDPVPEGALTMASNIPMKDTLEVGEPMKFKMAFKNISPTQFDSVRLYMTSTDPSNTTKVIFNGNKKPIVSGDTIMIDQTIDTKNLVGDNAVYINFNPNNAQPEQYLFNNYLNKNIYVRPDTYAPNLDVTFDGIHILNKDIVSPKPSILIKLKDDSRYLALNDTSLFSIRLVYPDGRVRSIRFDNDTLQFSPSKNLPGGDDNAATLVYKPFLKEDGEYELIVTGKDVSSNKSGSIEYRVAFEVYNKSMITNLLNYPNPFTSSTAFVFTLTGTELPSQFRIQILTVTGKVVREVTKQELGPIKIGHNITEYKWDGKDQFGQSLANGVYLYRVIADINGKKIDKLKSATFNTDKYFQSGYGKMYLMR
jgi:hypothetical protein